MRLEKYTTVVYTQFVDIYCSQICIPVLNNKFIYVR